MEQESRIELKFNVKWPLKEFFRNLGFLAFHMNDKFYLVLQAPGSLSSIIFLLK